MSDKILRALMRLFAIIAKSEDESSPKNIMDLAEHQISKNKANKEFVVQFLRSELNIRSIKTYIDIYDDYVNELIYKQEQKKSNSEKRNALSSVKVLRICSEINQELTQRQKFIVLIQLIEFIQTIGRENEKESDFLNTVSEMFNINIQEYSLLKDFLKQDAKTINTNPAFVYVLPKPIDNQDKNANVLILDGLDGYFKILRVKSINTYFFHYSGHDDFFLNGQISTKRTQVFNTGSRINQNIEE